MSGIKRKLEDDDEVQIKKTKCATKDVHGGAWEQQLLLIVKEKYNVELIYDIADVIFMLASGRWNTCCACNTETDDACGTTMIGIRDREIGFYCDGCCPWVGISTNEFHFTDAEDEEEDDGVQSH